MEKLYVSPTQLEQFKSCPRKWFYGFVQKLPKKERKFQALGTEIDKAVARWLVTGDLPEDPRVQSAIRGCVEAGIDKSWRSQVGIKEPIGKSVVLVGYADFVSPRGDEILDLKTTKSERYIKEDYELVHDIQLNTYAFCLKKTPNVSTGHIAVLSEGRLYHRVTKVTKTHAELSAFFTESVEERSEKMVRASRLNVLDVPIETTHCSAYGGCDFEATCLAERKAEMPGINPTSVMDKLKAKTSGAKPVVIDPPKESEDPFAESAQVALPPSEDDETAELEARLAAMKAAKAKAAEEAAKAKAAEEAAKAKAAEEAAKAKATEEAAKAKAAEEAAKAKAAEEAAKAKAAEEAPRRGRPPKAVTAERSPTEVCTTAGWLEFASQFAIKNYGVGDDVAVLVADARRIWKEINESV